MKYKRTLVGGEDNTLVSRTRSVKGNLVPYNQCGIFLDSEKMRKKKYYYASKPHNKWMNRLMKIKNTFKIMNFP
jgi:hypothetical protein